MLSGLYSGQQRQQYEILLPHLFLCFQDKEGFFSSRGDGFSIMRTSRFLSRGARAIRTGVFSRRGPLADRLMLGSARVLGAHAVTEMCSLAGDVHLLRGG